MKFYTFYKFGDFFIIVCCWVFMLLSIWHSFLFSKFNASSQNYKFFFFQKKKEKKMMKILVRKFYFCDVMYIFIIILSVECENAVKNA